MEIRPRSEWEIISYLKRKGYEQDLIDQVVKKLYKLELLNDDKFARLWVEWRLAGKPSSKRRLQVELRQKHISSEIIEIVLSEIDGETELAQVQTLIARKGKLSQYQDPQKLMAYLARQGFSYHLIKRAMAE